MKPEFDGLKILYKTGPSSPYSVDVKAAANLLGHTFSDHSRILPIMLAFPRPLVSFSLLWGLVIASCQQIYTPPNAQCWDYQVPVTVSAEYYSFAAPKWSDNQEFTEFIRGDITRTPGETSLDVPKGVLGATVNKTSEYIISATFCMPRNRPSSTVILATHGLGFDRSYVLYRRTCLNGGKT